MRLKEVSKYYGIGKLIHGVNVCGNLDCNKRIGDYDTYCKEHREELEKSFEDMRKGIL